MKGILFMKRILLLFLCFALLGCATIDYEKMSNGAGIPMELLKTNCKKALCSYDDLKDNVQVSVNDENMIYALTDIESKTIEFTWVSSWDKIKVRLYYVRLYGPWEFIESAEIYINKDMVAEVKGEVDRHVGKYKDSANEYEKIEIAQDYISIEQARLIAEAPHKSVTIRFYGDDGYIDQKLPRKHNLIKVVNIASSINH